MYYYAHVMTLDLLIEWWQIEVLKKHTICYLVASRSRESPGTHTDTVRRPAGPKHTVVIEATCKYNHATGITNGF